MPKAAKQTPNGPPKKPRKPQAPKVTMLQVVPKQKHRASHTKTSSTRAKFLVAFEQTFGNITASCAYAGITRRTYYRWVNSETPINRKFQKQLDQLKPQEAMVDFFESSLIGRVQAMDTTAIIYGLKAKGRHRGWNETRDVQAEHDTVTKLVDSLRTILIENPNMSDAERSMWIKDFADSGGVPEETLARKIRVLELTGGK